MQTDSRVGAARCPYWQFKGRSSRTGGVGVRRPAAQYAANVETMGDSAFRSRHQGLLGTVVELRVETANEAAAMRIEKSIIAEIERLEHVFSAFDYSSELSRWQRGEAGAGAELSEVLRLAERWRVASGGAFNPASARLSDLWRASAAEGAIPMDSAIAAAVDAIRRDVREEADPTESRSYVNLNAIAKGWIVDRAVAGALDDEAVVGVTVNAGGDLLHRGSSPLVVGIEDPRRPYDNVPPLTRIKLIGAALATSGTSRRGFLIDERWYSHVVDPRTGWPISEVSQASVVAPDAATADAIATTLTVLRRDEIDSFATSLEGVGFLRIDENGETICNYVWRSVEL